MLLPLLLLLPRPMVPQPLLQPLPPAPPATRPTTWRQVCMQCPWQPFPGRISNHQPITHLSSALCNQTKLCFYFRQAFCIDHPIRAVVHCYPCAAGCAAAAAAAAASNWTNAAAAAAAAAACHGAAAAAAAAAAASGG